MTGPEESSLEEYEQKAFDLLCANQKKQTTTGKSQVKKPLVAVKKAFKKPAAAKRAAATHVAKTGESSGGDKYTEALACKSEKQTLLDKDCQEKRLGESGLKLNRESKHQTCP